MDLRLTAALVVFVAASASPALALPQAQAEEEYHFVAGLYEKGLHDLVVKEARAFLKEHPRHERAPLARYRLASSLFELQRPSEAAPEFERLSQLSGFEFEAECWFRLGQCRSAAGEHGRAIEAFARVLKLEAPYLASPATFLLAEAEFQEGRFAEAEAHYRAVSEAAGKARDKAGDYAAEAAYGLAWCAFRLEQYDACVQRIERFLRDFPKDPAAAELRFLAGEAHLEAGRAQQALAAYGSVREGEFAPAALRGKAFAEAALQDHAAAARSFGELLQRHPNSPFAAEAALHRGIHLLKQGRPEEASAAFEHPAAPAGPELTYWRAVARRDAGDSEAAVALLDRALRMDPDAELRARIHVARGDALYALGRGDEAAASYARSNSDYALHAAAIASLNDGRADEAVRLARQLLEQFPDSSYAPVTRLTVGMGLFEQERYGEAESALRAALDAGLAPELEARALARLGWCRFLGGDPAAAADSFAAVLRQHPRAPEAEEALYMQGRCQAAAGDAPAATRSLKNYLQRHAAGEHRAEALFELAQLEGGERGRGYLEQLLASEPEGELAAGALFELAEQVSATSDHAGAAARYEDFLRRFPSHERAPAARYGLGWSLYNRGEHARAVQVLSGLGRDRDAASELRAAALELAVWSAQGGGDAEAALANWKLFLDVCGDEPRRLRTAKTVALALRDAERFDDAQTVLDDLLETAQDRASAIELLVEGTYMALERGQVEEAEQRVRIALRYGPQDAAVAEASFFVGEARYEGGERKKAAELYAAVAGAPECKVAAQALYKEGFARLDLEDVAGAAKSFRALTEQHAQHELYGESLFLLGEALYRLGSHTEAADVLERLLREQPRHEVRPKALFRLGLASGQLGRWERAEAVLGELVQRHPQFQNLAEAELWRGKALAARGNARAARQAFDRVLALDPGVLGARARLELGRMSRAAGDLEDALSQFLKVAVLYAHDAEVAEALLLAGECLEAQGDQERAAAQYREVLEKHGASEAAAPARERLNEIARG